MDRGTVYVLAALALIGVASVYSSGRRSVKRAGHGVRRVTRMGGSALRTLVTAGLIVAVQWAVIARIDNPAALAVVLALPALFAGTAAARLLAVTEFVHTTRKRGGKR